MKDFIMKKFFTIILLFFAAVIIAAPQGKYDWSKAEKLHDGILHAFIYPKEPRLMKIHTVRVDLQSPGIDFIATAKDKDFGKPMPDFPKMTIMTKRLRVRDFVKQKCAEGHNVLVAANATPWSPWRSPFTHIYGGNISLLINEFDIIGDKKKDTPAFIVNRDNKVEIRVVKGNEDRKNFRFALAGFSIILKNSEVVIKYKDYHPRTCYGISADGRYLYLMTVDGRQKLVSEGASVVECAEFMRYFGAADAINMDGGGSTTLVNRNAANGKIEVLSHQAFGGERRVATSLGIIRKKVLHEKF